MEVYRGRGFAQVLRADRFARSPSGSRLNTTNTMRVNNVRLIRILQKKKKEKKKDVPRVSRPFVTISGSPDFGGGHSHASTIIIVFFFFNCSLLGTPL